MTTEKDIGKLLVEISRNKAGGYIITRPLSDTIEYAKVWPAKRSLDSKAIPDNVHAPDTFYFTSEKSKKYIAAVLVTENDLRWYLFPEYRKGNLFSTALKETILPHILQHKPVQRMTLNRTVMGEKAFLSARKIAVAAGFKLIREEEVLSLYAIEAASLEGRQYIPGINTGITEARLQLMASELKTMLQILNIIKTEIEMKTGSWEYSMDYEEIIKNLRIRKSDLIQFKGS
jgi:hypothetical protein